MGKKKKGYLKSAVDKVLQKDGGHIVPNALIGFDPAAGEDRTVVLERWMESIRQGQTIVPMGAGRGVGKTSLLAAMARTPSTAKVHPWAPMAHPIWPYGTVIKPTIHNPTFHDDTRHMVVGRPHDPRVLVAIDLRTETPYAHLLEDIEDRWEVEEAP